MSNVESIKQAIADNEAIQTYFKQFSDSNVRMFIDSYAAFKNIWLEHGIRLIAEEENHHIHWVNQATEHLQYIQQKKLFDTQCLWRAEQLQIPEVQLCYDFNLWEKDILNCPFIAPVDESDIELYAQYLLTHYMSDDLDIRNYHHYDSWQDHAEIIEAYKTDNENRNFPEWYDFYNGRRGTGVYMSLPDIRGEKEEFYMELARNRNKTEKSTEETPPYVPTPFLSYYDKAQRDWFVQTFENKEVQEYYRAYEWSQRNRDTKEVLEYYLDVLYEADEPVAIEGHQNWSEAVKIAAQKYACTKIAEALPEAWEQYMINIQMNIAFPNDIPHREAWDSIRKMYAEGIVIGRKLNNEPENLDF